MHISQIVRKWRESGEQRELSSSSFQKVVNDVLPRYEKELDELRKQFPQFIGNLQDIEVQPKTTPREVKEVHREIKETPREIKEIQAQPETPKESNGKFSAKIAPPAAKDPSDDWDREMRDFTRGLYDGEDADWKHEDNGEVDNLPEDALDEEEEDQEDDDVEDLKDDEDDEGEEAEGEEDPVNLEKLLQSMQEEENNRGGKDNSPNKGTYHSKLKRKSRGNIDRRRRKKKSEWQDPKKSK